jgi:hypothetical protein
MKIKQNTSSTKNLNDLTPKERREALNDFDNKFQEHWMNQQFTNQGITFPKIASKYGNAMCNNDHNPDPKPPKELFNFDLILNGRRFQVLCDTLIRINKEEDLADFSETQLKRALEMCAAYRMTCFCAYIAAHREYRKWKAYHELWLSEKRKEARDSLRAERIADKNARLRKDLGQITLQEIEDHIITNYQAEYKSNLELISDWEENEKVFLELRDTLKDRGMHLQTLLRRVTDNISPKSDAV